MNIIVLGAGAIGTLYGAWLSAANDVTLVARHDHADRIATDGVRITGLEEATYRVKASTSIRTIERDTVIFLTTKVTGSAAAIDPIVDLLRSDTTIVCLQNGLGSEDLVGRLVGNRCLVVRGITHFGAIFAAPGVVALKATGYTLLAPSARSADIADALSKSRLDGRVSSSMKSEIWRKLIFNCVVNPLTAMTRNAPGGTSPWSVPPDAIFPVGFQLIGQNGFRVTGSMLNEDLFLSAICAGSSAGLFLTAACAGLWSAAGKTGAVRIEIKTREKNLFIAFQ